ncbi:S8 family serine peptidase [Fluviispira multicolorata]|uniref:S8 family serine peptidase n=1 Tax=Fluviispira multicolorata TaxID=2654512 RepID=A0A833JCU6_9BACT|nr:S8 family serine peptidase [Fluviispira multicolorata]KAB8027768.1 S8 family serine peptidase [Fluviispira multicolorata]
MLSVIKKSSLLFLLLFMSCSRNSSISNNNLSSSGHSDDIIKGSGIIFDQQWYLKNTGQKTYSKINATPGIDLNLPFPNFYTGKGINVLVSDTGIDFSHQDLKENLLENSSLDFVNNPNANLSNFNLLDKKENDHGTNVAGMIGGSYNKENGFRGIAPAVKLASANYMSEVLDRTIISDFNMKMKIYNNALDKKIHLINESYSNSEFIPHIFYVDEQDEILYEKIKKSQRDNEKGFIIVKLAGNYTCDAKIALDVAKIIAQKLVLQIDKKTSKDSEEKSLEKLLEKFKKEVFRLYTNSIDENSFHSLTENQIEILKAIRPHLSIMDDQTTNPYIITVSALSANGNIAYYSSIGANIWITGLGGGESSPTVSDGVYRRSPLQPNSFPKILTTRIAGREKDLHSRTDFDKGILPENEMFNYTAEFTGTSAAAPSITGVIALMLEANPKLSFRDVKYILAKTANKDKLTPDPKPSCIKILEKIGEFNNSFSELWNKGWTVNAAGNSFHNYYGFGLIDADKAIQMAINNYKSPFENKPSEEKWYKSGNMQELLGREPRIQAGNSFFHEIEVPDETIIEAIQVTPYFDAYKADGISVEIISPSGTHSTLLYPGNSLIKFDQKVTGAQYPANFYDDKDSHNAAYTSNAFYEENSKGKWRIILKNHNTIDPNNSLTFFQFAAWKLNIIGHKN